MIQMIQRSHADVWHSLGFPYLGSITECAADNSSASRQRSEGIYLMEAIVSGELNSTHGLDRRAIAQGAHDLMPTEE
jgi:hypothetical protein